MADIVHRLGIKTGPDKVYWALSTIEGLAAWRMADTSRIAVVGNTFSSATQAERPSEGWRGRC